MTATVIAVRNTRTRQAFLNILPAHLSKRSDSHEPFPSRVQTLASTDFRDHLAGLCRLLLHPQGVLGGQARHRRRPELPARQGRHGQPRRHLPGRLCRGPVHLGHARRPVRPTCSGARRLADLGGGGGGDGQLCDLPDLRHLHADPGAGAVHRLGRLVQEHRQLLPGLPAWASAGAVEFVLCLRRPGGVAVCRLVGLHPGRHLARSVLLQCGGGRTGGRAVLLPATQQARGRRPAGGGPRAAEHVAG
ncbi:hypothetical protein D3C81_673140 [compost metagenome]